MTTVKDIYGFIDAFAPFAVPYEEDNIGIIVGDTGQTVTKALLSLDITTSVAEEARNKNAQLIISHHPVIYKPLYSLQSRSPVYLLAAYGISALCAHTNLDMADGGVNTCLAELLGLTDITPLQPYKETFSMGLIGTLPGAYSPVEFALYVKNLLGCGGIKLVDGGKSISRVAICGGGSGDMVYAALAKDADAFVTGDSRHHEHIFAKENGLTFVEAGHFHTENVVIEPLRARLQARFPDIDFVTAEANIPPCEWI